MTAVACAAVSCSVAGAADLLSHVDTLIGFILTRQPAIWMGDWGEVRIPVVPKRIEAADYRPYVGRVTAGGRRYEHTATAHAAWIRGNASCHGNEPSHHCAYLYNRFGAPEKTQPDFPRKERKSG